MKLANLLILLARALSAQAWEKLTGDATGQVMERQSGRWHTHH